MTYTNPRMLSRLSAEDRNARILLLAEQRAKIVERRVGRNRDDVGPRCHDLAHQRVAEIDDRFQKLAFLLMPVDVPASSGGRCR